MSTVFAFLKRRMAAPLLAACCLCALAVTAQAQIISTVAGNGTAAYGGDGGAATAAQLKPPVGVLLDNAGNLYIADSNNNVIRKVSPAGIISTVAGNGASAYSGDGGAATSAGLKYPTSVALDAAGNLYIADAINNVIRKVNAAGIISTVAGNGAAAYSGDGGAATSAKLNYPNGVTVDGAGNLYISDTNNNVIRKVSPAGIISTVAGNGVAGFSGDTGSATAAQLTLPFSAALDSVGNLYIADASNNVIRKVNAAGIISTVAGNGIQGYSGDGGAATSAKLKDPTGVVLDSAGNLYIADANNSVIRKVSTAGIISTVAGNGTNGFSGDGGSATAAQLSAPYGIALDSAGNLYVADYSNNRIRKIAGLAPPAGAVAVPSLSPVGLVMLAMLLGGVAVWRRRQA